MDAVDDLRQRCAAHGRWMAVHPDAVSFAEAWADRNHEELEFAARAHADRPTPTRTTSPVHVGGHRYGSAMNERRLLVRLARGDVQNVRFDDVRRLAEALGFERRRVAGSHHTFAHPGVPELVNLQEVRGQAKPYQLRQLMKLVERYDLALEGES